LPDAPETVTTVINGSNVKIYWTAANDQGSPITSYIIKILASDSKYYIDLIDCDGLEQEIVT
jgi:hypothetical protein